MSFKIRIFVLNNHNNLNNHNLNNPVGAVKHLNCTHQIAPWYYPKYSFSPLQRPVFIAAAVEVPTHPCASPYAMTGLGSRWRTRCGPRCGTSCRRHWRCTRSLTGLTGCWTGLASWSSLVARASGRPTPISPSPTTTSRTGQWWEDWEGSLTMAS